MEFYDAVTARRSVRRYQPDPIDPEVLARVLEATRIAPSANNVQPWRFILVEDAGVRKQLVPVCAKQKFIAEAPLVIVACGLPTPSKVGGWISSMTIDVAIAIDHLTLAAAAEGLGTCWIGAFDNDGVKDLLGIPAEVQVVGLTPLGVPATAGSGTKHRKATEEITCRDRWTE